MSVVYAYCEKCQAYITIDLPADIVSRHQVYPFPYTFVHGDPPHALTIYLDQDLVERGHEVSDIHPESHGPAKLEPQSTTAPSEPTPSAPLTGAPSRRMVPRVTTDLDKHRLSVTEFRLLNLCDGKTTLQEIAEKLGLQFFACMRMALDLQKKGILSFEKRL